MATNNVGQNNRTVSSKKIRLPKDLYKSYIKMHGRCLYLSSLWQS